MTQFDKLYTSREKLVKTVLDLEEQISQGGGGGGGGTSFSDLGFASFNSATTYSKGDVVEKDGTLYEFTTSHTGDWDDSDVQATSVEDLIDEHYVKPSGGIPSTDLASVVQTSLGKADTALQSSAIANMEVTTNKVTSLSSASTDTQYPSAKCVYDLVGDVETLLAAI